MKQNIVEKLRPVIQEIVNSQNLNLYDLEYVFEDNTWILRVSIEKEDGTMDFETAEVVSDIISAKLDEIDPIDHYYILDVGSPGAERPLKTKQDYINNINQYISVYLKEKDANGKDLYTGDLLEVNESSITMSYKDKTRIKKITIDFENVQKAHLAIKF